MIGTIRLNLKVITSQPGKQAIATHILPNMSRSKSNHILKFGQLTEHNIKIVSLENYTLNVLEKLFPDLFLKIQKSAYLRINSLNFYKVCFYCMISWELSKYIGNILEVSCRPFTITSNKAFLKNKEVWNWCFYLIFCLIFEKKCITTDQISLYDCLYSVRYWTICVL